MVSAMALRARELIFPTRWLRVRAERLSTAASEPAKKEQPDKTEQLAKTEQLTNTEQPAETGRRRRRPENPLLQHRHAYPEFLPNPNPLWRNTLREKLERADMIRRRQIVDIPEFYVGSVLAVTFSDPHAQGKTNRFVGICIDRSGSGLRAEFILRNVVNHQGIEVRYEQYDPAIQKIQVLRLEKRLDGKILYMRDALPEYYTYDFNMDPEILPDGAAVPVNTTKVKLKPRPWLERWERQGLLGVANIEEQLNYNRRMRRQLTAKPWEKYDLMKTYRNTIPEEEQSTIWSEVYTQLNQLQLATKKLARKKSFNLPADKLK